MDAIRVLAATDTVVFRLGSIAPVLAKVLLGNLMTLGDLLLEQE